MPDKKSSLKISNANSMFANQPKRPTKQDLDKSAKEIKEKDIGFKEKAAELAVNFRKMLDDKTLVDNKNQFSLEIERESINNLAQLAIDMNNDEYEQQDGMGSVGLAVLLFRCILIQRDKINKLDYAINEMNNAVNKLKLQAIDIKKPVE
jgi:hypothetical protein